MEGQYMHKNRLQEYAQREAIPFPIYQTVNEGSQHAPQFRSTVLIDGTAFSSSLTFPHRKAAEQDAARVALEGVSRKIKHEAGRLLQNVTVFCKSILNEYAVKVNLDMPSYNTIQQQGPLPSYFSTVVFAGKTYYGAPGRNKRSAEQMGAQAVIASILGDSSSRNLISQIIKSKSRFFAAVNGVGIGQNVSLGGHIENYSTNSVVEGKELQVATTNAMLPVVPTGGQLTHVAAPHSFPFIDKEYMCKVVSGSIASGISIPPLPQDYRPAGSTSKEGLKTDEFDLAHFNRVTEISSISRSEPPTNSQGMLLDNCRKRLHKVDEGEIQSKKGRTDEPLRLGPLVEQ